jgi:tetratricopeptide (TPR) repeat protein
MARGGYGMKKPILFLVVVGLLAGHAAAQSEDSFYEAESDHYMVRSEVSVSQAARTASKLEAMMELYNDYFHFDTDQLQQQLQVRIFADKSGFDQYLRRVLGETREDFVYLHYGQPAQNELVGYHRDNEQFDLSLTHQNFIQYFRAFVDNPPLWMREGFAVFFEQSEYDDEFEEVIYRENLSWLETLQGVVQNSPGDLIPISDMLSMTIDEARDRIDIFYPQAWGMVSFLVNSDHREVNRILWDSISALEEDASLSENVENIRNEVLKFVDVNRLTERFVSYVEDRKSFRGLVEQGMTQYENGEFGTAEETFVKATSLRDENYVPYYYLGLINYDRNNYQLADFYYRQALDRGAGEALTYYALGVNAYADRRFGEAQNFLQQTVDLDSETYGPRAENLLSRLEDS